jgi:hypothetical protein
MAGHGLRRRRLKAPNPVSAITAMPSSTHGPRAAGGSLGGPVAASAVAVDGETDGANATIAGEGVSVGVVASDGVAVASATAGGAARVGGALVAAGGPGQTWLKVTAGGRVPVPTE